MSKTTLRVVTAGIIAGIIGITLIWSAVGAGADTGRKECEWLYVKVDTDGNPYPNAEWPTTRWMEDVGTRVEHEVDGYWWEKVGEPRGDCESTTTTTVIETTTTTFEEPTTTTTVDDDDDDDGDGDDSDVVPNVNLRMQCPDDVFVDGLLAIEVTNQGDARTFDVHGEMLWIGAGETRVVTFDLPPQGFVFTVYVDDRAYTDLALECGEEDVDEDAVPPIAPVAQRDTLPRTGASVGWLVGIALVSIGGGVLAYRLTTRRY